MAFSLIVDAVKFAVSAVKSILEKKEEGKISASEAEQEIARIEANLTSQVEMTYRMEMETKGSVMMAELKQDDTYTKRARPTLVYAGLVGAFLDGIAHAVLWGAVAFGGLTSAVASTFPVSFLPLAFWTSWGAVSATYAIGRTAEKRADNGQTNPAIVNAIANAARFLP